MSSKRAVLRPKVKCCESRKRCSRCPLQLLKEGRMPDGYGVRHRHVVRTTAEGHGKIDKVELEKAVKRSNKARKRATKAA